MTGRRMLVCTADREGGWCFGSTHHHSDRKIVLDIFRVEAGGVIVHHPMSRKVWKYGKAKDKFAAIEAIHNCMDKIGLMVGALVVYESKI